MNRELKEFGRHYLIEYLDCDAERIQFVDQVREVFIEAANVSGATIVGDQFKQYEPVGVTGIILIAESHFSLHTWPEDCFVAVDIFTCGEMNPQAAIDYLQKAFSAGGVQQKMIIRKG